MESSKPKGSGVSSTPTILTLRSSRGSSGSSSSLSGIIFLDELDFRALRGFGRSRGRSGEGGAELARFRLFPVLMEVCVDFDAAFLVFG